MDQRFEKTLKKLRREIDRIDRSLLRCFSQRMTISEKMGRLKKKYGVPVLQKSRWSVVMASRLELARRLELDSQLVHRVFKEIHRASILAQKKVKR